MYKIVPVIIGSNEDDACTTAGYKKNKLKKFKKQ